MRGLRRPRSGRFRHPLGAVATLVAIAALAVVVALLQPPAAALAGRAEAVDGDTLRIGSTRVRLIGLDAIELDQNCTGRGDVDWACGQAARSFLARALRGDITTCHHEGRDRYGRTLARCATAAGDLGDAIVRAGWAVADLEYGLALAEARLNGRGIWASRFDDPAVWRQNHGADGFDLWAWLASWYQR